MEYRIVRNTKRIIYLILFTLFSILYSIFTPPVHAGGLFANTPYVQSFPTEFRALIVYDGKKETIYDSVTFNVNPVIAWNYSYVIAVPSKPTVEEIQADMFPALEKFTEKLLSKDNLFNKILFFDVIEENNVPPRVYTRPLDITKIRTFGPEDKDNDMENYLAESGYSIPKDGKTLVREYQTKNWYFIVAEINVNHLQIEANESLTVPGAHTYPIKIEFETNKLIYPLKLAKVQPDYDSETIALNYEYGTTSESVLGVKDESIDNMLAFQSKNKYPQMPFQYSYPKTELFVIAISSVEAPGFIRFFSSPVTQRSLELKDYKENGYLSIPPGKLILTGLYNFRPVLQLEDIELKLRGNQLINAKPNPIIQIAKLLSISMLPLLCLFYLIKRRWSN